MQPWLGEVAGREALALLTRFAEEMNQVGTLVLTDTFQGDQPMLFGPEPGQPALTRAELAETPRDGVGALLRFATAPGTVA